MNRVLNVSIVFGLACTLACAPGSRQQTVAKKTNQTAAAPAPSPVPPQTLTPVVTIPTQKDLIQNPSLAQKNLDMSTYKLTNAQLLPPPKPDTMQLSFTVTDTKNVAQTVSITVDSANSTATLNVNAADLNSIKYVCNDGANINPPQCSDVAVNFIYKGIQGTAKVVTSDNLKVTERIRDLSVTAKPGENPGKDFSTAMVQKLDFNLGSQTFSRTNAMIKKDGVNPKPGDVPQDKELSTDGNNIAIEVYALPTTDLDGITKISLPTTLNINPGRMASDKEKMILSNPSRLRYSIQLAPDKRTLTLLIRLAGAKVDSSSDSPANVDANSDGNTVAPVPPVSPDVTKTAVPATTTPPVAAQDKVAKVSAADPGAAPDSSAQNVPTTVKSDVVASKTAPVTTSPATAPGAPAQPATNQLSSKERAEIDNELNSLKDQSNKSSNNLTPATISSGTQTAMDYTADVLSSPNTQH